MISILYPTMNNLPFLQLAVRSVEENSAIPFEIVIFDNGSTDGTREWAERTGHTYIRSESNLGLSIPTNTMVEVAKYPIVMIADNDTYLLPSWDSIVPEIEAGARWRIPMQIRPDRPTRAIVRYYGSDPSNFQEDLVKRDFRYYVHPFRHKGTFLGLPVLLREDYLAIGGFNEEFFCSEQQFLWEAHLFYEERRALQLTCPTSFYYHFGGSTPRPEGYGQMIQDAKDFCRMKHGLTEEEMDRELDHFAVHSRTYTSSNEMIKYP